MAVLTEPDKVQPEQRRLRQIESPCPLPLDDRPDPLFLLLRGRRCGDPPLARGAPTRPRTTWSGSADAAVVNAVRSIVWRSRRCSHARRRCAWVERSSEFESPLLEADGRPRLVHGIEQPLHRRERDRRPRIRDALAPGVPDQPRRRAPEESPKAVDRGDVAGLAVADELAQRIGEAVRDAARSSPGSCSASLKMKRASSRPSRTTVSTSMA